MSAFFRYVFLFTCGLKTSLAFTPQNHTKVALLSLENDSTSFSMLSSLHLNLFSFHLYIYRLKLQKLNLSPPSCVLFFLQLFFPTLDDTLVFMQTLMSVTLALQHSFVFKPKCLNDCGTLTYLLLPATALFSVHLSKTLLLKPQYR